MAGRMPRKYARPDRRDIRNDLSRYCFVLSLLLCFPELTLFAQTLQLSSAAASPGAYVAIEISLESPQGRAPAALQWETIIRTADLSFTDKDIAVGPAAQKAGKSVGCAVKRKTDETITSVCILAGGQEQIQNGVIALLRLRVSPEASIGHTRILVERAIAVMRDATEAPIKPLETAVFIRAK